MPPHVDLHVHTTASDGSFTPREVVQMAKRAGLAAVAITDHDTVDGVAEGLAAGRSTTVEVISGVELSVFREHRGTLHLLGYWVDPEHRDLSAKLEEMRQGRNQRNREMLERLLLLGFPLDFEEVRKEAGGQVIGRPHIARALVARGHLGSTAEAFERLLSRGKPAYVERKRMSAEEALEIIRRAGGVAVLAHPGLLPLGPGQLEAELIRLREAGLAGVEVLYPDHPPKTRQRLDRLARRLGLAPTGGTDFHGAARPEVGLGSVEVPAEWLEELRARIGGVDDCSKSE